MKKIMLLAIIGTLLFCKYAKAGDWEDIWAPYLERDDKATATSGNAQAINQNTQMITPWPYYVRNRNIPTNGARMVGQYTRYTKGRSLNENVPFPSDNAGGGGGNSIYKSETNSDQGSGSEKNTSNTTYKSSVR
jgi:hypothetical protein